MTTATSMTNTDFENVFYKSNFADGVTIQSNYMTRRRDELGLVARAVHVHLL